jgi:hypothetical protein
MDPYAPPKASIERPIEAERLLGSEAHVRGIGLIWLVTGSLDVFVAFGGATMQMWSRLADVLVAVIAGLELRRLRARGRTLLALSVVLGMANAWMSASSASSSHHGGGHRLSWRFGLGLAALAFDAGVLGYLFAGKGARVLQPTYAELLARTPSPAPRTALWAKMLILAGALSFVVWTGWVVVSTLPRH